MLGQRDRRDNFELIERDMPCTSARRASHPEGATAWARERRRFFQSAGRRATGPKTAGVSIGHN